MIASWQALLKKPSQLPPSLLPSQPSEAVSDHVQRTANGEVKEKAVDATVLCLKKEALSPTTIGALHRFAQNSDLSRVLRWPRAPA